MTFKRRFCLKLFITLFSFSMAEASDLTIENVRMVNRPELSIQPHVIFDLSWKNVWKNEKNHDAVWVFFKYNENPWEHPKVNVGGHVIVKNRVPNCPDPKVNASEDGIGIWITMEDHYRGDVNIKLKVFLDTTSQKVDWRKARNFQVYGLEMVYIPSGPFTLGDPSGQSDQFASFYKSDDHGCSLYRQSSPMDRGRDQTLVFFQL